MIVKAKSKPLFRIKGIYLLMKYFLEKTIFAIENFTSLKTNNFERQITLL